MTLWELWSFGDMPYGDLNGPQIIKMLEDNKRLEAPNKCPPEMYKVCLVGGLSFSIHHNFSPPP